MKTMLRRFIAGATLTILASASTGCSPMVAVPSRPRQVVYTEVITPAPVPVQTVVVAPIIPVWAPPVPLVTEVHYYYFPDYMMYYDLVHQHYCYYSGTVWMQVAVLPSLPVFYGFDPFCSYIVVLNHSVYQPWIRHDYYIQQYPVGYYNEMYAPRTSLGSNTILRAYDENQSRPLFVDKRSNKEVKVKYDVRPTRNSISRNETSSNTRVAQPEGRSNTTSNPVSVNGRTGSARENNTTIDSRATDGANQRNAITSRSNETKKVKEDKTVKSTNRSEETRKDKEVKSNHATSNPSDNRGNSIKNNQSGNRMNDSKVFCKKCRSEKEPIAKKGEMHTKVDRENPKPTKNEKNNTRSK